MAKGDLINYTNFKAMHGESWDAVLSDEDVINGDQTLFICGLSFIVSLYADPSFWGAELKVNWTVSYYNGSSWVTVLDEDKSTAGMQYGYWANFYHNRSAEGTSSQDMPNYHLWKVTLTRLSGSSAYTCMLRAYVGGIATMTETEYNNVCKGKLMKAYRPDYWRQGGTYGSADEFLAGESPQVRKGTLISVATGTYKWLGA